MGVETGIEWTDATWNPVAGCDKVSPGCRNCYAIRDAHRLAGNPNPKVADKYRGLTTSAKQWSGIGARFWEAALAIPLHWRKPRRVFVNSQSDLFHDDITDVQIAAVFGVMAMCPRHTFQILTKRPERMVEFFQWVTERGHLHSPHLDGLLPAEELARQCTWPLPNVWLGVSVENQAAAEERIPLLLQTPAAVRFVSCEPLLGPVDLRTVMLNDGDGLGEGLFGHGDGAGLDWVICGGESGPGARPMHPEWARLLRDQCAAARVPFFFKQWGEWMPQVPGEGEIIHDRSVTMDGREYRWPFGQPPDDAYEFVPVGKHAAGRELDGRTWNEFPKEVTK